MNKRCVRILSQILCLAWMISLTPIHAYCKPLYSLFDLAQLADKHSQTIKIAQEDLYIAEQEKKRALSALIPRAVIYGSLLERKDETISHPNMTTIGGKLTQEFTINGKELIAYNITKDLIETKSFSLDSVRSQYFLAVSKGYYDILSAQRYFEIAQSNVDRLTIYKNSVKERLSVGNVTKTDLFRAEAELSKSLTDLVISKNNIFKRKADLRKLVDIEESFELEKDPPVQIKNYQSTLEQIQNFALKNRYEIKEATKNYEIALKTVDFDKSDYWPKLSLETGYRESDLEYSSGGVNLSNDVEDLYVSAELNFTLYDGGLRKATIRQRMAGQRKAKNVLELTQKDIILEAKNSFYDYETAKSALINLQDELKSAKENLNAVTMQLQYGMADSIDAIDANTLLVSAQRRISDAQYVYYLSVLKILYTRGELIRFLSDESAS